MHAHVVFVTKFRHNVFTDDHLVGMEEITRSVCADFECEPVEFNGKTNHVHLLVNFPPKVAVTKLVNSLKGVSSRRLRLAYLPAGGSRLGPGLRREGERGGAGQQGEDGGDPAAGAVHGGGHGPWF
nr:IS200/IS605 family transposase [Streptomyces noursei]